jgi:tetratricopeptide (TPR) repeat protein
MVDQGLELATTLGDRGLHARALAQLVGVRLGDPESDPAEAEAICEDAIATQTELGDERGLALSRKHLAIVLAHQGRAAEATAQLEQALVHAAVCRDQEARRAATQELCHFLCLDATPVADAIERSERLLHAARPDRTLEAIIERPLALLHAMAGRSEDALHLVERSDALLDPADWSGLFLDHAALARELAGDLAGAERQLVAMRLLHLDGIRHHPRAALRAAAELGRLYCDQERWDDAEEMALFARSAPLSDDSRGTAARRLALEARIEARRGRYDDAAALAESAVARAEARESNLNLRAVILAAAAEVHQRRGADDDAEAATARALELYERKGNIAAAAQLRTRRPAMAL